ncbi:M15 family metallopeptidase [Runella slithyformis]|nr:M15 family metallopeptidase [Runella slithyformis]
MDSLRQKKKGYRAHPIELDSSHRNEPLIDLRLHITGINHYFREDNPPYYFSIPSAISQLWVRETVFKKLKRIEQKLRKVGLKLFVFDAYRPVEVQNYFHDVWFPEYLKEVLGHDISETELRQEVEKFWAKGAVSSREVDLLSPPPHSTGAAVDLCICRTNNESLFFGGIFDDVTESAYTDYFEQLQNRRRLTFSETEALQNRRLLYWIMTDEGFVNNPSEWWHFSYGDQMWAKLTDTPAAIYSSAWWLLP